jgi:hypothetical protein
MATKNHRILKVMGLHFVINWGNVVFVNHYGMQGDEKNTALR